MGWAIGPEHTDKDGTKFHLEAKSSGIAVWTADEMTLILKLTPEGAEALAEDLRLHAGLYRRLRTEGNLVE